MRDSVLIMTFRKTTSKFACGLICMCVLAGVLPVCGVEVSSGYVVEQVSFDFCSGASQSNSTWGRFTADPVALTGATGLEEGYVNMHVSNVGWVVQNLYVTNDGTGPVMTSFDLGIAAPPQLVTNLHAFVDYDGNASFSSTAGPYRDLSVGSTTNSAQGLGTNVVMFIDRPFGPGTIPFVPGGDSRLLAAVAKEPNVQAACNQCVPMAIANSLQFLEDRWNINVPNHHVIGLKGDASLVGQLDTLMARNVTNRKQGKGMSFEGGLSGKFAYLKNNGLEKALVHRHHVTAQRYVGGVAKNLEFHGIASSNCIQMAVFDFIKQELDRGADVELGWFWDGGGGHMVRVVEARILLNVPQVGYIHDSAQTNIDDFDNKGLEFRRSVLFDADGDGLLNIHGMNREVEVVISESFANGMVMRFK